MLLENVGVGVSEMNVEGKGQRSSHKVKSTRNGGRDKKTQEPSPRAGTAEEIEEIWILSSDSESEEKSTSSGSASRRCDQASQTGMKVNIKEFVELLIA
jgi:hypothetical protein